MPLNGFTSLCSKNAKQIVSRDKGNPQYHKANNVSNSEVTQSASILEEICFHLILKLSKEVTTGITPFQAFI